jgi:hypothetical protein
VHAFEAGQKLLNEVRRDKPVTAERLRYLETQVRKFVERAPLEESILVLDGPGLGCAGQLLVLRLLGVERLRRLKAIHAFSASSLILLCVYGRDEGLLADQRTCEQWFRTSQKRHGIRPGLSLALALGKKLMGRKYLFPVVRNEEALTCVASPEFCSRRVRDLPPNLHFWCHNRTAHRFEDIHAGCKLDALSLKQLMQAMCGIPQLWEPLTYEGSVYGDALLARGVRSVYKQLRGSAKNALFLHMHREGERGNTIFIKPHQELSGYSRVVVDFLYFMLGLDCPDFAQAVRLGLFELSPLELDPDSQAKSSTAVGRTPPPKFHAS